MNNQKLENNNVTLTGTIESLFVYDHEAFDEEFYMTDIAVERLSGQIDHIPVVISERLMDVSKDWRGTHISVKGQFRSFNHHENEKTRLKLYVFVTELDITCAAADVGDDNEIILDGFICKPPVYRKTPLGREITDLQVAVNRSYGKSDYIPCICWGRTAIYASGFNVGQRIKVYGRVQSREYVKKISEAESETRTAYEVSANRLIAC